MDTSLKQTNGFWVSKDKLEKSKTVGVFDRSWISTSCMSYLNPMADL